MISLRSGGRALWRVKAGSLTLFGVAALLIAAVIVSSGLDNILFSALPTEIHRENCVVSEVKQIGVKEAVRKNMSINLFYFNDENRAQIISPLYVAFYKQAESQTTILDNVGDEDIYHQDEQSLNDDIGYLIRIDASELLWLSGKGLIVEGGERRYFRLQFPADQLKGGDEFANYIGSVPCKLLIPKKGEVTQVGVDSRNAPSWRLDLKSRVANGKESLTAINVREINGDTTSDVGATGAIESEKTGQ